MAGKKEDKKGDAMEVDAKDGDAKDEPEPEPEKPPPPPGQISADSCKSSLELIEQAVKTKETRFVARAMRQTAGARKGMNLAALTMILGQMPESELQSLVFKHVSAIEEPAPMAVKESDATETTPPGELKIELTVESPESQVYLVLVAIQFLLDHKALEPAFEITTKTLAYCQTAARRSLDTLHSSVWFYHSLCCEKKDMLPTIRPALLAAYRTSVLTRHEAGQATYLNLLLRNYLTPSGGELRLVDQADKLVSLTKSSFPESASNNQFSRYFYYIGMIKTIQLEYSEALNYMQEALRKSPQTGVVGFKITVSKWIVIVQLLKGEIPPRAHFMCKPQRYRTALAPYLELTQAVRNGDLAAFKSVADEFAAGFAKDGLLSCINRLRHNVIKTGLRNINVAYTRISVADVCAKLNLEDTEDAEYIVAKAIRDGVIEAKLDHRKGEVVSSPAADVYSTAEPQELYHKRIQFCLNIHNEAVQAMSYPEDMGKEKQESAEERLELLKQEAELAKNIAEEEEDEF